MTTAVPPLRVNIIGDRRYRVTGGTDPHIVEREADTGAWGCDCRGFAYRHRCTHVAEVLMFRERICAPCPPALAAYVDRLTDEEVLALCDIVGPSAHRGEQCGSAAHPADGLEAEAAAILQRCQTRLLELEADLAGRMGQRKPAGLMAKYRGVRERIAAEQARGQ